MRDYEVINYSEKIFEDKIGSTHPEKELILKKKIIIWVIVAIVLLGLLIQLIPLPGRGNNPAVVAGPIWDSPQTRALVKRACFDCHSNETRWTQYAYIALVSWLIYHDVILDGRKHLNFSEWHRPWNIGKIPDMIQTGEMPPFLYRLMHPEAQLTDAEKQQLITGLMKSLP